MQQYLKRERDRESSTDMWMVFTPSLSLLSKTTTSDTSRHAFLSLSLSLNESVFCVFFVSHFVVGLLWSLCIFKRGREQTRFLPKLCFRFCP